MNGDGVSAELFLKSYLEAQNDPDARAWYSYYAEHVAYELLGGDDHEEGENWEIEFEN